MIPVLAAHNYLYLFEQYIDNFNPSLAVKCLKKAENLIKEKAETSYQFAMVNFLGKLDRDLLEKLLQMLPNNDPDTEYLQETLLKKDFIRITFEESLNYLIKFSAKIASQTCFICFNVEEEDVSKWLKNNLIPDLERIGIKPIVCFRELGPGKERDYFQNLIKQSDFAIIICTPLLKKKCDACRNKATDGVAEEIRLIFHNYNKPKKAFKIGHICFKGDFKSSYPLGFFEPVARKRANMLNVSFGASVFKYYSKFFRIFGRMCGIVMERSRDIKLQFLSKTQSIIYGNRIDMSKVDLWRNNRIHKNKILLELISDNINPKIGLFDYPSPPQDFTGRKKELNELHEAFKNNKIIFITGPDGVGKTSLALKYADEYKSHYKFIQFIKACSQESIVQELIKLADKMDVPSSLKIPQRLSSLKNRLNEFNGDYLIIFDGIDRYSAWEELGKQLPNNSRCILLTSKDSEYIDESFYCKLLSLTPWSVEEAVDYLLTTTKSDEINQAIILSKKLLYLPLALNHASAYIRNRNYTICKYIEKFNLRNVELIEKKHIQLTKEEKIVFVTWQIALNAIENYHKCFIAKPMLNFFSLFSQTFIPLIFIEHWFKTFFCYYSEFELLDGLRNLYNYSMIDNLSKECYTIHLLVQNVVIYLFSYDEYRINLEKFLNILIHFMQVCEPRHRELWPFIRIIIPHNEMFIHHLIKVTEINMDRKLPCSEELYIFFNINSMYLNRQCFFAKTFSSLSYCKNIYEKTYGINHKKIVPILRNIGLALQEQGKFSAAEANFQKALEIAKNVYGTWDHRKVVKIINNIGSLFKCQNKLDQAKSFFEKALQAKIFGDMNNLMKSETMNNIGVVLQEKGMDHEFENYYIDSINMKKQVYGTENHPDVARVFYNLGLVHMSQKKLSSARSYFIKAIEILSNAYCSKVNHKSAKNIYMLAQVLQREDRLVEAESLYIKALSIVNKLFGTRNNFAASSIIYNMGMVLQKQFKLDESESCYRLALDIETKICGTMSFSSIAEIIYKIGYVLQLKEKFDEAKTLYMKVIEIEIELHGTKEHIAVTKTIYDIGYMLELQGKFGEAEAFYREALEIETKLYGTREHPEVVMTIGSIGKLLQLQGRFNESEAYFQEALKIRKKLLYKKRDRHIAKTMYQIGYVLQLQGRFNESEAYFQEALKIRKKLLYKKRARHIAKTMYQIGYVLRLQGKFNESEAYFQEALEIKTKLYGTRNHLDVIETIYQIGVVLQKQYKLSKAEVYFREVLEIQKKIYGTRDCYEIAVVNHNMGDLMQLQGKFDQAEAYLRKALEVQSKVYGTNDHPDIAKTISQIGSVLQLQDKLNDAEDCFRKALEIQTTIYRTRDNPEVVKTINKLDAILKRKENNMKSKRRLKIE